MKLNYRTKLLLIQVAAHSKSPSLEGALYLFTYILTHLLAYKLTRLFTAVT